MQNPYLAKPNECKTIEAYQTKQKRRVQASIKIFQKVRQAPHIFYSVFFDVSAQVSKASVQVINMVLSERFSSFTISE